MLNTDFYIGYSLDNTENVNKNIEFITKNLNTIIGVDNYKFINSVVGPNRTEITIRINQPVMNNEDKDIELLVRLREFFIATGSLEPYLCKYRGEDNY